MFSNLILPLAAVMLFGVGTAFAEPGAEGAAEAPPYEGHMNDTDADKDGAVSDEESAARAGKKFDEIDTDKDGTVSTDEMDQYREAEKAKREAARASREAEMKKKYHEKVDPDGDGKITRDEFIKNAADRHEKMDANSDGKVTKDEIKRPRGERRSHEGPAKSGEAPAQE